MGRRVAERDLTRLHLQFRRVVVRPKSGRRRPQVANRNPNRALGGDGTPRYQGRPEAGTASSGIPYNAAKTCPENNPTAPHDCTQPELDLGQWHRYCRKSAIRIAIGEVSVPQGTTSL